jgi:thiamine biosynthesis lipoprotein
MKKIISAIFLFQQLFIHAQLKLEGEAQGTTYHIQYADALNRNLQYEIDSLLYFFDLGVSTYVSNSQITLINNNSIQSTSNPYFIYCFNTAKRIWKNTKGAFDPTVYPFVNMWGFGPESYVKNKPTQDQIDSIKTFVGFSKISLRSDSIIKYDPRVRLDFNAFAQGYSVDVVGQFLETKGIYNYLVEIGGEVFAKGPNWLIGIESPEYNKSALNAIQLVIKINGKGVATSGNYRKYVEFDGIKYAHHIDPRTGYPTKNRLLSDTVISNETIISDATATGLLVLGLRKAKRYLKRHQEIDALLIYSNKSGVFKSYYSKHWNYTIE